MPDSSLVPKCQFIPVSMRLPSLGSRDLSKNVQGAPVSRRKGNCSPLSSRSLTNSQVPRPAFWLKATSPGSRGRAGSTVAHEHKSSRLTSPPNTRGFSIVFTGSIRHTCQSSGDSSAGSDHLHAQGAIFRLPPAYYRLIPLLSRGFGSLYISGTDWERKLEDRQCALYN